MAIYHAELPVDTKILYAASANGGDAEPRKRGRNQRCINTYTSQRGQATSAEPTLDPRQIPWLACIVNSGPGVAACCHHTQPKLMNISSLLPVNLLRHQARFGR